MRKSLLVFGMLFLSLFSFAQIQELEISVGGNDTVLLTWNLPVGNYSDSICLSWLINDTINDRVQAGYDSYMGNLYDTLDLRNFIGWKIESVSFYKVSNWTHTIYIWKQRQGDEMQVLYLQEIPDEMPFGLNTIQLEEELVIEPNTCYWFALRTTHYQSQQGYMYSFGMVFGEEGVEGKTNLCMMPGSNSWFEMPLPYEHFWIRACLVNPENAQRNEDSQPLTGYRVYRDGQLIKEIPYSFVTYFTDTDFTRGFDVDYCVTAVYGDEESEPVCATASITGIAEAESDEAFTVSPNPTTGRFTIEGASVARVEVYSPTGQKVCEEQGSKVVNIDATGWSKGIYLVKIIEENDAVVTKKLVVR